MSKPPANKPPGTESPAPPATATQPQPQWSLFSQRSLKQLGIVAAGIGSIVLSTVVTRRAVAKHHIKHSLKAFQPSNRSPGQGRSGENIPVAVEALQIATLNLASWTVFAFGGLSWAFDISTLDELKRAARKHTRGDPDQTDAEAEEKFQEELVQLMSKYMSNTQVETLLHKAIEEKRAAGAAPAKDEPGRSVGSSNESKGE